MERVLCRLQELWGKVRLEGSDLSTSAGSSTAEQAPAEQAGSAGRKEHANFVWTSG